MEMCRAITKIVECNNFASVVTDSFLNRGNTQARMGFTQNWEYITTGGGDRALGGHVFRELNHMHQGSSHGQEQAKMLNCLPLPWELFTVTLETIHISVSLLT